MQTLLVDAVKAIDGRRCPSVCRDLACHDGRTTGAWHSVGALVVLDVTGSVTRQLLRALGLAVAAEGPP